MSLLLALLNNYRRILNIKVTMKGNIHLCRYQCLDGEGVAGKGVAIEFFSIFSVKFPTLRTGTLFKLIKYPFLCLTKLQSGTKFVVKLHREKGQKSVQMSQLCPPPHPPTPPPPLHLNIDTYIIIFEKIRAK